MVWITKIIGLFSSVKTWVYIVAGITVVVAVGGTYYYIKYLQNERDLLQSEVNKIRAVYEANVKELDKVKYNHEKSLALLSIQHKEELEKIQKVTTIKEEIKNVKKDDDAPVANILRDTIHRLQQ